MTQTFEATPLTRFLHAARPDWTLAELLHVEAKLEKIGLASVPALLQSLIVPRWSINELLQLEGEKGFSQETWRAFRAQAEKPRPHPLQSRAPSVLHSAPEIRPLQSELPQQGFRVVEDLEVRERPSVDAPSLGSSLGGDTLLGVEETFDGWVKLADRPGWVPRERRDFRGVWRLLVADGLRMPVSRISTRKGPQSFAVLCKTGVQVFDAPCTESAALGRRMCGEWVVAESQTYHGWLRLAGAAGWVHCLREGGSTAPMLTCPVLEEEAWREKCATARSAMMCVMTRNSDVGNSVVVEAREALRRATAGDDAQQLHEAFMFARAAGLSGDEVVLAEARLDKLRDADEDGSTDAAERQRLGSCIQQALRNETELRRLKAECKAAGFHAEVVEANDALERLMYDVVTAELAQTEHVERVVTAMRSGRPEDIRVAVLAAKGAGVPKREIARVHALHCVDGAC